MLGWLGSLDQNAKVSLVGAFIGGLFALLAAIVGGQPPGSGRTDTASDSVHNRRLGGWLRHHSRPARWAITGGLTIALVGVLLTVLLPASPSPPGDSDGSGSGSGSGQASPSESPSGGSRPAATAAPSGQIPTGNPYPPGHRTVVLDEPMIAENGKWRNLNSGTGTCRFASDGYHVGASNYYHECYGSNSVRDFTYEVEFSFGTARVAGVFFRQTGAGSWYFAAVGRSGKVWLNKGVKAESVEPELFTGQVKAPDPGRRHRLAVTGVGNELTVYVDEQRVGDATDNQFGEGLIGVYTDGGKAPDGADPAGETVFHHVRLWQP